MVEGDGVGEDSEEGGGEGEGEGDELVSELRGCDDEGGDDIEDVGREEGRGLTGEGGAYGDVELSEENTLQGTSEVTGGGGGGGVGGGRRGRKEWGPRGRKRNGGHAQGAGGCEGELE